MLQTNKQTNYTGYNCFKKILTLRIDLSETPPVSTWAVLVRL